MSVDLTAALRELVREEVKLALLAERVDTPDRLLNVNAAAAALGVGRSMVYDLIARGEIRSLKVGKRRLVPARAIAEYAAPGTAGERADRPPQAARSDKEARRDRDEP